MIVRPTGIVQDGALQLGLELVVEEGRIAELRPHTGMPEPFVSSPSMYATYGSSYFFRTEIAFRAFSQTHFKLPADVNVLFDGAGHWHGDGRALQLGDDFETAFGLLRKYRYTTLFGDMHVKSLTRDGLDRAWATDL